MAGVAAQRAEVLDDALRAIGARPKAEPDPRDVQLLADAAADLRTLITQFDAVDNRHPLPSLATQRALVAEQLGAVGGEHQSAGPAVESPAVADDEEDAISALAERVRTAATSCHDRALAAGSLAVTQVLASIGAGLCQLELGVGEDA